MEPVKALIFGIDDLFPKLKPYYDREIEKGNLEIVGYAIIEDGKIIFVKNLQREPLLNLSFQKIIISSQNNFMPIYKAVKAIFKNAQGGGISLDNVIDGRIFRVLEFDFPRFCFERIAYGKITKSTFSTYNDEQNVYSIHPKIYQFGNIMIKLGVKSYIEGISSLGGGGLIQLGNFSAVSWEIKVQMGLACGHNYHNVSSYGHWDWNRDINFFPKYNNPYPTINIGSDVWIGRGCYLKVSNPDKPLNIGNGAVVASDSVVVKDVPPFAIVGGNPAKFIKWRFEPEIIEALERIAWWNWDLEKIYDNFHLFKDPKEFVNKFDPQR